MAINSLLSMTTPDSIVVDLEHAKMLKEAGWPQERATFVYVQEGQKYGDGYGNTASELTEMGLFYVGGPAGELGEGRRSSGGHDYMGDIKFPAVHVGEYGDDNYYEYPVGFAAPTAEEILQRLPAMIDKCALSCGKDDDGMWLCYYETLEQDFLYNIEDMTLANAAAAMWTYLKENNLLPSVPEAKI